MKFIIKLFNKLARYLDRTYLGGGVYYINTYDALPPPLDANEEIKIIGMLENDKAYASNELIRRNLRLVVYIARKFESYSTPLEDMISIGTIGLIKAVNTFNAEKNIKLATYASKCIENEILMHIRKTAKQKKEISFDEPLTTDKEGNELLLSDVISSEEDSFDMDIERESEIQILKESMNKLNKKERDIINMRFGMNGLERKTQKQIADMMMISQSYISRLEKRIVENLKREVMKMIK